MKKIALITGASSGIGRATAIKLAAKGYNLILTGRQIGELKYLADQIEAKYGIKTLCIAFNIKAYKDVKEALGRNLPHEWSDIDVLINNAGIGLNFSPIHLGDVDSWDIMIDTNIKGLLYVTRAIAPNMVNRRSGHIINIGSIMSRKAAPNINVYSATKYAVDGLSKNMSIDLQPYGVRVTQILPGRVRTGFALVTYGGDERLAEQNYNEFTPLEPENIADAILFALSQPQHVDVKDIIVAPSEQK